MDESTMVNGKAVQASQFPPKELLAKAFALINAVKIPNLASLIATRDNMVTLGQMPDMIQIMGGGTAGFKLRMACWVGMLAAGACAWMFSWWILAAAFAAVAVERWLAAKEKKTWKFLAAVLLSLEVLANDFAGWGTALPEARRKATNLMGEPRQTWLDLILPGRAGLDASLLRERFGPSEIE